MSDPSVSVHARFQDESDGDTAATENGDDVRVVSPAEGVVADSHLGNERDDREVPFVPVPEAESEAVVVAGAFRKGGARLDGQLVFRLGGCSQHQKRDARDGTGKRGASSGEGSAHEGYPAACGSNLRPGVPLS